MNKLISILIILHLLTSCQNDQLKEVDSKEFYKTTDMSVDDNIMYHYFSLDTIKLQKVETSFIGHFLVNDKTIYFVDERFNYVSSFDKNGKLIEQYTDENDDILTMNGSVITDKYFISFSEKNNKISVFSDNFKVCSTLPIDLEVKRTYEEILNNPIPSLEDCYEYDYGTPFIIKQWDKNHIVMAITASHPKFNGYFDSDLYYGYSRIFAIVNTQTGKVDNLLGRRSPIYFDYYHIPNFDHFNYDTNEHIDEVYINFYPDPIIYIYSKKLDKIIGKFGKGGRNMHTDYRQTNTYEEAEFNFKDDKEQYGAYTFLKYFPQNNCVARGYYKGKNTLTDGLQLYRNKQLIADVDVPKGLQLIGEIDGEYYATLPQELGKDYLAIYKLKKDGQNTNTVSNSQENIILKNKGTLKINKNRVDIGEVEKGKEIRYRFTIKNIGIEKVDLLRYQTSCNCTKIDVSAKEVSPLDTIFVEMTIDTENKILGKHNVYAVLITNGQQKRYNLELYFTLVDSKKK